MPSQVFVGAGDIAICGSVATAATADLLDFIGGTVFTAGDNVAPEGTAQQYVIATNPRGADTKICTRPTPGNHEYAGSPVAAPVLRVLRSGGRTAWSWLLQLRPGGLARDLAQQQHRLRSELRAASMAARGPWLEPGEMYLAYWHHPRFTSGPNGDNPGMRDFWRVLYAAGVEIVVNAHDHLYERFGPQDPDGFPDPVRGIRQFIAGTGGAPLYDVVAVKANSEVVVRSFGVLKLTLEQDSYRWEFIPVSGGGDFGTGTCH